MFNMFLVFLVFLYVLWCFLFFDFTIISNILYYICYMLLVGLGCGFVVFQCWGPHASYQKVNHSISQHLRRRASSFSVV